MSVVVYVIQDELDQDRTQDVSKYFPSDKYIIIIPNIHYNKDKTSNDFEAHFEGYQVGWCLLDAKENYPKHSTIIIKDTSITNSSQKIIDRIINYYHNHYEEYDIGYLSKWEDKCHLHAEKQSIEGTNSYSAKTSSPYGLQSIIVTPNGRELLIGSKPMKNGKYFRPEESLSLSLNRSIHDGNIDALCVVPNLFSFDLRFATQNNDFLKTNECQIIDPNIHTSTSTLNQYIIILIIIILFVFIVWAAIKVSP